MDLGNKARTPDLSRLFTDLVAVVEPTLDFRVVARRAHRFLLETLAIDRAGLYLLRPDGKLHIFEHSLPGLQPEEMSIPTTGPLVARLIETRRPLLAPVSEHPNPGSRRLLGPLGITTLLFLPLTTGERFLGFFVCSRQESQRFGDLPDEMTHALGRIVGVALEQARLLADARARLDSDRALLDAARVAGSRGDPEAGLAKYAEALALAAGAACSGIILPDPSDETRLRLAATYGTTPEEVAEIRAVPFRHDSPVVAAAHASRTLLRFETPQSAQAAVRRFLVKHGYTHFFVLPLVASDAVRGVALITGVEAIEPDLQPVVEAVGHEIALAIETANEREGARRRAERETLEEELRRAVRGTFDLNAILQEAVDKLGRTLGAARCYAGLTVPGPAAARRVTNEWRSSPALSSSMEWKLDGNRPIARLAKAHNEVVCHDVVADARFGSVEANSPGDLRSFVLVNCLEGEFSKGWIVVAETDRARRWQDEEVRLVRTVAEHCGIAIRRAELQDDAHRRAMELELTISQMTDPVIVCNERLEVTRTNEAARQMFWGRPIAFEKTTPGPSVSVHDLDGRELAPEELPIVRAVRFGEVVRDRELLLRLSPAEPQRVVISSASPLRDASGRLVGGVIVMKDVTEARAAAVNAGRTEKLRVVGELAASVAHDINNTLAAVLGSAQVIVQLSPGPEVRRNAEVIAQAARDASVILGRLTRLSQRTHGTVHRDTIDLVHVAEDAVELTRPRWLRPSGAIATAVEATGPVRVRGVAAELREVLTNLILNAVDALPAGGRIVVRVAREDGEAVVEVSDDGAGMSDDVLRQAFEPFFTTKGDAGTGLGLSISSAIVAAHGGRMNADSATGRGTRIRVHLPLATETPPAAVAAARGGGRVLVVDDDPRVRSLLVDFLAGAGHRVTSAGSGEEALRLLDADGASVDVLVTDFLMPGMSGLALLHEARARYPELPVVLVSGFLADAQKAELESLGAHVLTKPFRSEDVSAAVAAALCP